MTFNKRLGWAIASSIRVEVQSDPLQENKILSSACWKTDGKMVTFIDRTQPTEVRLTFVDR
jgi:hypothetical protein